MSDPFAAVIAHPEPCPICNAKPGEKCGSIVDASKYLEQPHAGRVELASKRSAPPAGGR